MAALTPQIRLVGIGDVVRAAVSSDDLQRVLGARVGEAAARIADAVKQTDAHHARVPRDAPFGGYLAVDVADDIVVGCGGFKGGPSADGEVEIAYGTFPPFEGRGYATAMALALTRVALGVPSVRRVIAHTLPEVNASGSVLTRIGMRFCGAVEDPEDGTVWRWEMNRPPSAVDDRVP